MRHFNKIDWRVSLSLLFASVLTVIASCVAPSGPLGAPNVVEVGKVASVHLTLAQSTLAPGQATQATVVAKSADGTVVGGRVDYLSKNPAIATASSNGVVTAIAAGIAVIQATVAGHGATADVTVQSFDSPVAVVAVAIDSTTLQVGHVAQAVATAKDASGNTIPAPTVTWTSLAPSRATVSPSGAVTAVAEGAAVIRATVAGIAGTDTVLVVAPPGLSPPDLASQNFDGGSVSPYINFWDPAVGGNGDVDVVDDPTGAGKGKVARMHYVGTHQDRNRLLQYTHYIGFGTTIYSRGEFYLDVADLGDGFIARKLIYYLPHEDFGKYGGNVPAFGVVVGLQGHSLYTLSYHVPADGSPVRENSSMIYAVMSPRTWYTLETQITPETSIGAGNAAFRVWLNGALIYEKTDLQWTDPAWIGQPMESGTPLELADVYLERVEVGEQVNYNIGSFDEYRYWDNVAFSTKRIAP